MDQRFARLVHIQTGDVESHFLRQMPPYIAISHTWMDRLFSPGIPFAQSSGRSAIMRLLELEEYSEIAYCWIDTLCIYQEDDEDKHRQIPLMGQIYGGAEAVAILVKESLGLTQAKIDAVTETVRGAVEMSRDGSWLEHGQEWVSSEKRRRNLRKATEMLEVFTRPAWGSRVWTMQEFILAKRTVWIGGDLQPLKVDEWLFNAVPDVCDNLSIEECLVPKYARLYSHFQGMAGAHLKLIDSTRVMELLGNKSATVPEDEVYGLMSASGVILEDANTKGKEEVWARWWEKAIHDGNLRWALLPPASVPAMTDSPNILRNCIIPQYAVRHLCSSNSALDTVEPYGPFDVNDGTVSMTGRLAGQCRILRRLGRIYIDAEGLVVRDVTLCLFTSKNWDLALKIASAFGAGRYNLKQRVMIAQTLVFNYYRAKLAVMANRTSSFKLRFRNLDYAQTWSDFMLLQSIHMRPMNEGVAFLATISNDLTSTTAIVVTSGQRPSGNLWAIDFGAINESDKTMFTIVKAMPGVSGKDLSKYSTTPGSPSLHREGVSMYMQVTPSPEEAVKYASHILDQPANFQKYKVGGAACFVCSSDTRAETVIENADPPGSDHNSQRIDPGIWRYIRAQMLKQNEALKRPSKKRAPRR